LETCFLWDDSVIYIQDYLRESCADALGGMQLRASRLIEPIGTLRSICEQSIRIYPKSYLTVGRGGTNLRVGFIELLGPSSSSSNGAQYGKNGDTARSRVGRKLEKSWPIGELLKQNKAEDLFKWIGECVAEVVQDGCQAWPGELPDPLPMGVTFSFPMMFDHLPHFQHIY
jgi:hypothetical protein